MSREMYGSWQANVVDGDEPVKSLKANRLAFNAK